MNMKRTKASKANTIFAVVVFQACVMGVQSLPQKSEKTDEFLLCLEQYKKGLGNTKLVGDELKSLCQMLTEEVAGTLPKDHQQHQTLAYFHSLHKLAWSEMKMERKKRFTFRRIRKEIRSLSMAERKALFRAVNDLKKDTSVFPNVYDAFANLHTGRILRSAYHGPNFLGWNRYYLYLFETALRTKNPTIVLPYWDSTLDFNMNDPIHTVMFSSEFMGNVDATGGLESGPLTNWGIVRDIGQVGSVMSEELLESILTNPQILHHAQIVENGPKASVHTIEGQQNNVHAWIGGMMADRKSSPKDPIFFFHRCFVDHIWELFREKQISHGVNPETDYPNMGGIHHDPDRHMDGFPWVKNIDGYSNNFTNLMYQYDDRNQCPLCHRSKYLHCVRGKCRSVSTMTVNEAPMAAVTADMNVANSHIGKFQGPLIMESMYEITFNDTRIRGHPRPVIIVRNPSDQYLLSEGIVAAASSQIAAAEELRFVKQLKEPIAKHKFQNLEKLDKAQLTEPITKHKSDNVGKVDKVQWTEPTTKHKLENVEKLDKVQLTEPIKEHKLENVEKRDKVQLTEPITEHKLENVEKLDKVQLTEPIKERKLENVEKLDKVQLTEPITEHKLEIVEKLDKVQLTEPITLHKLENVEILNKEQLTEPITKHKLEKVGKPDNQFKLLEKDIVTVASRPLLTKDTMSTIESKRKQKSEIKITSSNDLYVDNTRKLSETSRILADKSVTSNKIAVDNTRNTQDTSLLSSNSAALTSSQTELKKKAPAEKVINIEYNSKLSLQKANYPKDQIFLTGGIVAPSSAKIAVQEKNSSKVANHVTRNHVNSIPVKTPSKVPHLNVPSDVNSAKESFDITSRGLSQPNFIGSGNVLV